MLNQFGRLLAEAMFEVGISSYSELLKCLWDAGVDPKEASSTALVDALTATKVDARPDFSPEFWRVLFSAKVLDISEDKSKELMHAYVTSEDEMRRVLQQRGG
jgi:hypothetical protein